MPFTIEEIEATYLTVPADLWVPGLEPEERKKNKNYDVVMGYLTGQHHSLQELQNNRDTYLWRPLLQLLTNIESPSPNDQLVIDVVTHSAMGSNLTSPFIIWLAHYILEHPTEEALQAGLKLFDTLQYNHTAILELYCFQQSWVTLPPGFMDQPSPLKTFLLHEIKNGDNYINTSPEYSRWNVIYLYLTEAVRPDLAKEYAVKTSLFSQTDAVVFFATYKDGHYMPAIMDALRDPNNQALYNKLACCVHLVAHDLKTYAAVAIEVANKFLENYAATPEKSRRDPGNEIPEFKNDPPLHFPYSVIAFHLLLKLDKEKGQYWLQEFKQQKIKFDQMLPRIVYLHLQNDALPFLQQALTKDGTVDFLQAVIDTLVKGFDSDTFLPILWDATAIKSKPVKELIAHILVQQDGDAKAKATALLGHKKTEARLTAAIILDQLSRP